VLSREAPLGLLQLRVRLCRTTLAAHEPKKEKKEKGDKTDNNEKTN
jgi:hypothetical protein